MAELKWGIVGTGSVAEQFVAALSATGNNIAVAVASKNADNAVNFSARWGIPKAYAKYESLLQDDKVDAVYIATPNSLHFEHAILGLEHGKHVMLEKPFTLKSSQAKTLFQIGKENGLVCMEAMWTKYQPCIVKVKRLLESGGLGNVLGFSGSIGISHQYQKDHRLFRADLGGGSLYDLGIYPLTLIQYFSQGVWRPEATSAVSSSSGVDLHFSAQLLSGEGQTAQVTSSLISSIEDNFFIYGSRANLRLLGPLYRPHGYQVTHHSEFVESNDIVPLVGSRSSIKPKLIRYLPFVMTLQNRVSRLLSRYRNRPRFVSYRFNGYQYQIEEFCRQVVLESNQSSVVSSSDTIATIALIESILNHSHKEK